MEWDEEIPAVIQTEIQHLLQTRQPETIGFFKKASNSKTVQIYLVVDASILEYAAMIRARNYQDDQVQTNLIFDQQRLMPTKRLTITKVELISA